MFFILNHRNKIIVADKDFLNKLDVCDVNTASSVIGSEEIKIDEYSHTIEIDSVEYHFDKSEIYTLFGQGNIYRIDNDDSGLTSKKIDIFKSKTAIDIDTDFAEFFSNTKNNYDTRTVVTKDNNETSQHVADITESISTALNKTEDSSTSDQKPEAVATKVIDIDIQSQQAAQSVDYSTVAKLVGVSSNEYKEFLTDFISETNRLIPTIKSQNNIDSEQALETLKEATLLLHLPHLTSKIIQIQAYIDQDTRSALVDELSSISTLPQINFYIDSLSKKDTDISDLTDSDNNFASIDNIAPTEFEYDMNKAVTTLMLPEQMIKEFLADFVKQSKTNISLIEDAYNKNDLATIKSISHMLKGASSNLHIEPITQTLSILESNNNIENVPKIVQLFAGQVAHISTKLSR